jgi:hypothetical protein
MKYPVLTALCLLLLASPAVAQNSGASQDASTTTKATAPKAGIATDAADQPTKKPKKVWTNDEISSAGGPGAISVVGSSNTEKNRGSAKPSATGSQHDRQSASYRDRLRQLNDQLAATDKQISDLRNFKAENASASGGINMSHRYTTTSVEDQVKTLEDKRNQLQAQVEAVEDEARKNGVEPGQLR